MAENKEKENKQGITDKKETEIKLVNNESVHNMPEDINSNVGKFVNVEEPKSTEDEMLVEDKSQQFINIKNKDVALNFEKFDKKNKKKRFFKDKPGKTKFSVIVDTWLQNKRTCLYVWLAAIGSLIILLSLSIAMVTTVTTMWKASGDASFFNFQWFQNVAISGNVFSYIIIGLCVIPLLYLFVTILVGINGVYKSRSYHYFMWGCFIAAFVLLIVCLSLSGIVIDHVISFTIPSA